MQSSGHGGDGTPVYCIAALPIISPRDPNSPGWVIYDLLTLWPTVGIIFILESLGFPGGFEATLPNAPWRSLATSAKP